MKQILPITSLLLVFAVLGFAQQKPPVKNAAVQPAAAQTQQVTSSPPIDENYVIGLEDVLAINVWKDADHSAPQVVVRPDGKVTLPLIGDMQANGLTTKQLQEAIAERLKEFFMSVPTVTVTVTKIESKKVSIVGAVAKPGAYPLGAPITVLDLIARAGGLMEFAKTTKIKIVRKRDGKILAFNYKDVMSGKNLGQNVILENGDIVMVR
jgi:polysaccharide export outer membrane protein